MNGHLIAVEWIGDSLDGQPSDGRAAAALTAAGVTQWTGATEVGQVRVADVDLAPTSPLRSELVRFEHDGYRVRRLRGCGTCSTRGSLVNPNTGRRQTCPSCRGAGVR